MKTAKEIKEDADKIIISKNAQHIRIKNCLLDMCDYLYTMLEKPMTVDESGIVITNCKIVEEVKEDVKEEDKVSDKLKKLKSKMKGGKNEEVG